MRKLLALFLFISFQSFAQGNSKGKTSPDTTELPFKRITCFAIPNSGPYVIENKKQYKAFCEKNAKEAERRNYRLPKINFHKYVLMGFGNIHNEGTMLMDNHLCQIKSKKMIVFDVKIINRSRYDIGIEQQYWILIEKPKIRKYCYAIHKEEVPQSNK